MRKLLIALIAVELVGGAVLVRGRATAYRPPVDGTDLDPVAADEIRALATDARTPAGWANLADAYFAAGRLPEAEACYYQATYSGEAEHCFRHAFALDRLGDTDEAPVRYQEAIRAGHPRSADCWYHVGRDHQRNEAASLAVEAFEKCGDLPAARFELAQMAFREGRVEEALTAARDLARRFPDAQQPVSLQYRIAVARGDAATAAALADRFERMNHRLPNPLDTEANWFATIQDQFGFRGRYRRALKEKGTAAEDALAAALTAAWAPDVAEAYAVAQLARGRVAEAVRVLEDAIDRAGPAAGLVWRLGEAYEAAGRAADARAAWVRAAGIGTGPEMKDLLYKLATAHEKAGDKAAADAVWPRAFLAAGIDRHDAGRPAEALDAFREAVRRDPRLAHAWFRLGESFRELGKRAEAKAAYDRCRALDPDHGRAIRALEQIR